MKPIGTVLLTGIGMLAPAVMAAETVNWQVTVTAQEEFVTQQWQGFSATVGLSGMGGVNNYVPPQGTVRLDITVAFPDTTACQNCSESFTSIPLGYPYYAVWYTYLGGGVHKVQVFGGNVGGALLREAVFERYCPNGYRQMTVMFDALVKTTQSQPRSASAGGTMTGGLGEVQSAPWAAAPAAQGGGTLTNYSASVAGDNPKVELSLSVNGDKVSGTVTAKFPSCVPSPEVCDGADNDCDGSVDEDQGMASCGVGACATAVPACVDGKANACVPLPAGAEVCDGADNDCDGSVDEDLGSLSCGAGACANTVAACVGGQVQSCSPLAPQQERCDGVDNDCDGVVDNGCPNGIINLIQRLLTDPTPPPGLEKNLDKLLDKWNNRRK
ncbi:MAG: putative metal-binding motif-containing protein [Elusimicrobia bacterium]|nr:putative metal-binding motif-containing protein [Elusimicrobiota bacterium]